MNSSAFPFHNRSGFTIVELLIVIVVIAILAAISIVAYTGIQNTARNSAVQSNLKTIHQRLSQYQVMSDDERLPEPTIGSLSAIPIKLATASYTTAASTNVLYIVNNERTEFAVIAVASTGVAYVVSSQNSGVREYDGASHSAPYPGSFTRIADYLNLSYTSNSNNSFTAYNVNNGGWRAWHQ